MFHFDHDGRKYRVWFHHSRPVSVRGDVTGLTVASLGAEYDDSPFINLKATGMARCSETDQFNRVTGRRIAMARLLDAWPLTKKNKELRRSIWIAYARKHKDGGPILEYAKANPTPEEWYKDLP